jgi:hypothetical protein
MERAQAMILENCRVTTAEIAASLGINVARPWCFPVYVATIFTPYSLAINGQLNHTRSMSLTLSYSMAKPQQ